MCVIIDTNVLGEFLSEPANEDCKPIYHWMESGGKIVYLPEEKFRHKVNGRNKIKLNELVRKGSVDIIGAEECRDAAASFKL